MIVIKIILGILIYFAIGVFVSVLNCDECGFSYIDYGFAVVAWPIVLLFILIFGIIKLFDKLFEFIGRPVCKLSRTIRKKRGK